MPTGDPTYRVWLGHRPLARLPVPRPRPVGGQGPQIPRLYPGALDEVVEVLTPETDRTPAVPSDDLGCPLATINQGVHGAELQPKELSCAGCADPDFVYRIRHGWIVRVGRRPGAHVPN